MKYGFQVVIKFAPQSAEYQKGQKMGFLRNITDIDYNYNISSGVPSKDISFYSEIHGDGIVYKISDILAFHTKVQEEEAPEF